MKVHLSISTKYKMAAHWTFQNLVLSLKNLLLIPELGSGKFNGLKDLKNKVTFDESSLNLQIVSCPPKILLWEDGKIVTVAKIVTFISQKVLLGFIFKSLCVTNLTGCITYNRIQEYFYKYNTKHRNIRPVKI